MTKILYYLQGNQSAAIEVTEKFAAEYAEMEHWEKVIERKETRRHRLLDKSMEKGWEPPDPIDVEATAIRLEERRRLRPGLKHLTDKQKLVLFFTFSRTDLFGKSGKGFAFPKRRRRSIIGGIKKLRKI